MAKRKRVFGYVSLLFIFFVIVGVGIILYNYTNLFAKVAPKEYEITFVVDGEEYVQKEMYGTLPEFNGDVEKQSTPAKDYVFKGWEPSIESVRRNIVYTAVYDEIDKEYDITLDINMISAGKVSGGGRYKYGENVELKAEVNYGYRFIGWYDRDNNVISTEQNYIIDVSESKYYLGMFLFETGTINYVTGIEDVENDNTESFNISTNSFKLNSLQVEGYDFQGWYTKENGEGEKVETIDTSVIKNYTLYAYWTFTTYKISYVLNGGTILEPNPDTYTMEDTITLRNPFKPDGRFVGWLGTGLNSPTMEVTIPKGSTGDRNYVAIFYEYDKVVSVYLDNKLALTLSVRPNTSLSEEMLYAGLEEKDCIFAGYTIDNWYENSSLTSPYDLSNKITKNIDIYGKKTYIVNRLYFYPFVEEFDEGIKTGSLAIQSSEKLLAWIDYVRFYDVKEEVNLKLTYLEEFDENKVNEEIRNAYERLLTLSYFDTSSEVQISSANIDEQIYGKIYIKNSNWAEQATLVLDSDKEEVYEKLDYALKIKNNNRRAGDYNGFKINNLDNTIKVWTSQQLYYALEQGYRPVCEPGSIAERLQDEVKTILIEICNDDMTTVEKLRAIYEWLGFKCLFRSQSNITRRDNDSRR